MAVAAPPAPPAPPTPPAPPPRPKRYFFDRERVLGPLLLSPAVLYIVALVAIPFFLAIAYSLSDVTVGDPSFDFVGLKNFRNIWHDAVFRRSLRNSLLITVVTMVLVLILAKTLALVLVADFKGKWVVRFLVLLPFLGFGLFLSTCGMRVLKYRALDAGRARAKEGRA